MCPVRRLIVLALATQLLAGCGTDSDLDGVWSDERQTTRYMFRPGGRVDISALDSTVEADYSIDGERLIITGPQGTVVLKILDGRLEGPMGLVLHPAGSTHQFPEPEH